MILTAGRCNFITGLYSSDLKYYWLFYCGLEALSCWMVQFNILGSSLCKEVTILRLVSILLVWDAYLLPSLLISISSRLSSQGGWVLLQCGWSWVGAEVHCSFTDLYHSEPLYMQVVWTHSLKQTRLFLRNLLLMCWRFQAFYLRSARGQLQEICTKFFLFFLLCIFLYITFCNSIIFNKKGQRTFFDNISV
jgi:hypothetical protein